MGDYIPQEELEKFLSACNDAAARKAAKETVERSRIQADNVGHKLLSKMGWKEGERSLQLSLTCANKHAHGSTLHDMVKAFFFSCF